jgi:BASS family bile acid:Na+ symporter
MTIDLATLIPLAVTASIIILVFGLGLRATPDDATYLLRRPRILLRSLLAMYVVVPVFAALLATLFGFYPPVKTAMVLTAVSPVPPILPGKQLRLGARASYVYGLLVAASLFAIIYVPLAIPILGRLFGRETHESMWAVARIVLVTILIPLVAGLWLRRWAPALAQRLDPWASRGGYGLLLVGAVPILIAAAPGILRLIGNGSVLALAAVVVVGLIAGHLLGGPVLGDRAALAVASATRHPGVAMAIAGVNFPGDKAVVAAIILCLLVNVVVTIPYAAWLKRRAAGIVGTATARVNP